MQYYCIKERSLRPYTVHKVSEVANKDDYPHIGTVVMDSQVVVCFILFHCT